MKNLALNEYNKLCLNSKVLVIDGFGDKVLQLSDQSIIKLFRVKRLISMAMFYSPARRFARNARKLQERSIPTVSIIALYNIRAIARTAVHYHPLAGQTVREYMQAGNINDVFLAQLGEFLAYLHARGVFFRSAHFANIIYTNEHTFGLIDISDMQISNKALGKSKRLRNLKHIFRLSEDIQLIKDSEVIEHSYLQHCGIKKKKFHQLFLEKCRALKEQQA